MSDIYDAVAIAKADLRWCYRDRGIITGSRGVYWSWDSFFAGLGATRLGDTEIVRRNLELYLSYQGESGAIPKRIANPLYFFTFLGFPVSEDPEKQHPSFWNTYYTAPSLAQNPTFIIAFHNYVTSSNDQQFLKENLEKVTKVATYLKSEEDSLGLLYEGIGGGWAESVLKRGEIAFTNMCYAEAIRCLAELYRLADRKVQQREYELKHRAIKTQINERLWSDQDGGFYSDWYEKKRHHHFATDGNLLAILWDIADQEKAEKIQAKIDELSLEADIPIRLAYDRYAFWRVYIFNRIGGLKDYHVGFSWTWLGCIDALAKQKLGQHTEAVAVLERIATVIVRDQTIHEAYNNGRAVHTPFYKSEHPWAWGAGLFLYACSELGFEVRGESAKV